MPANFSMVSTAVNGQVITEDKWNDEFENILTNFTPTGMDDESIDAAGMQATTDPYPGAVVSLPTSLQGEIKRLRFIIAQITGESFWYVDPDTTLAALNTAVSAKADDTSVVHDTGNETIAGIKTFSDPPVFSLSGVKVAKSSGQSISNITLTEVSFDTETYDDDAMHDNVTNNGRLICKTAGRYLICAEIVFDANATGYRQAVLHKNGSSFFGRSIVQASPATNATSLIATSIQTLAVNDYVTVEAAQSSGGALVINSVSTFTMQKIS